MLSLLICISWVCCIGHDVPDLFIKDASNLFVSSFPKSSLPLLCDLSFASQRDAIKNVDFEGLEIAKARVPLEPPHVLSAIDILRTTNR